MELSKAVRSGYFDALAGNISIDGQEVNIYDAFAVPDQMGYPYILLAAQTANQRQVDRCKTYNVTINIDIVTGSTDTIGRAQSEDIAEQIENIINPDSFEDIEIPGGFKIGNTIRENDNYITDKNTTHYIYRKIITYNHLISI